MPPTTPHPSPQLQLFSARRSNWSSSSTTPSTSRIEAALRARGPKNKETEHQLKALDSSLTEGLTNFREIEGILQEISTGLQRTAKKADRAVNSVVPLINNELTDSMAILEGLSESLPAVQQQVDDISSAYVSGSRKADELVADLTWLNTDFYERWRRIIFTKSSPVSWRWKVYMRSLFIASFLICFWLSVIALIGAYRAHSHRLAWGDKLMS